MSEEKPNKATKSYEIKRIKDLPQAQQAALDELALLEQYQRLHALRTDSSGVINIPIILKIITGNSKETPSPYRFVADVNH